MKTLILFALMAYAAADGDLYVLEKVDIAALASNTEELKRFLDCLLNRGPCSELYLSYKVLAPETVQEACGKCTVELKQFGYQFFKTLKANIPEDYTLFKKIYDPENKYFDALEAEFEKYKN